jgi:hypothetical protein
MSELSRLHFLKISGTVDPQKKMEFESAIKFACGLMLPQCIERSLSTEILFGHQYYFFTSWFTENALRKFMQSEEYQLIRSAFDALGTLRKIEIGYNLVIKTIHIHQT